MRTTNPMQHNIRVLTLTMLLAIAVLAMTVTQMGSSQQQVVFSAKGGNSDEAQQQDNGNNNNDETNTDTDTETETDEETTDDEEETTDETDEVTTTSAAEPTDPTPGVGNNDNPLGQDNPQPGRVGSHDEQTSPNGAGGGGTVTDTTLCDITTVEGCSTTVDANCFGKVISERAQDHKEDPEEGTLGSHSRDPVPELPGNETPRQGIGNQDQGHPAAHGAFNSQFEDEDEENVIENC